MINYCKNVFLFLVYAAFILRAHCQYLLAEYAPKHDNYAPVSYSFAYGVSDHLSGDHKHQWEERQGDHVKGEYGLLEPDGMMRLVQYSADELKGFEATVKKLHVQIPAFAEDEATLYRVRRRGLYDKELNKDRSQRSVHRNDETAGSKFIRARYASASSLHNFSINNNTKNLTSLPNLKIKEENLSTKNSTELDAVNTKATTILNTRDSQKRIVKKQNNEETHFLIPANYKDIQYTPNLNLHPENIETINFQTDGNQFLHQLSSIRPHPLIYTQPQSQPAHILINRPPQQNINDSQTQQKLLINVPDDPSYDQEGSSENNKRIEEALSIIHSQPQVKNRLENLQRFQNFPHVPKYQPSYTKVTVPQLKQSLANLPLQADSSIINLGNYYNQNQENIRYSPPDQQSLNIQQTFYESIEDTGVTIVDGQPKYKNYGYINQNQNYQGPLNSYQQPTVSYNYQNHPPNINQNPEIFDHPGVHTANRLNTQNTYPAILVDVDAKIGLPFYPTSKDIYSRPKETFDYEGIPLHEQIKKLNNEYYNPPAERRLHTGLSFHASSRKLDNVPSLADNPPQKGDVIWQAGDLTTDPDPEILVRQLNETCAYIRFNETTPGTEDGTRYNIWNVGDYSAQRQEEELIRSVNITCDNYTTDALSNFTSGNTLADYCSQCMNQNSDEVSENNNGYDVQNQNVNDNTNGNSYELNPEQVYNNFYQNEPINYQFVNDNGEYMQENAQLYKRKRFAEPKSKESHEKKSNVK